MARVKNAAMADSHKVQTDEPKFSRAQLVASAKYADRRDLVNALLENKSYTTTEVDQLVDGYMKGQVK